MYFQFLKGVNNFLKQLGALVFRKYNANWSKQHIQWGVLYVVTGELASIYDTRTVHVGSSQYQIKYPCYNNETAYVFFYQCLTWLNHFLTTMKVYINEEEDLSDLVVPAFTLTTVILTNKEVLQ